MKKILIIIAILLLGFIGYTFTKKDASIPTTKVDVSETKEVANTPKTDITKIATEAKQENPSKTIIGTSVNGTDITAYHYGTGDKEILFIGGIHGGYSPNTTAVAQKAMEMFDTEKAVPANLRITVIPSLNPDGLEKSGTEGRFNARGTDLNRNFDCKWQANGTWQNKKVSGGAKAFSEPETQALRDYVSTHTPVAVIAWYSAANGVYASSCNTTPSAKTKALTNLYAQASGYPAFDEFDSYEVTGDMVNWFAKNNIPAISVLLSDHTSTDWDKNEKGIKTILSNYSE